MTEFLFCILSIGSVLDNQDDSVRMAFVGLHASRVEQHGAAADCFKVVSDFEVFKPILFGQNFFKQLAQFWNVPLTVSQVINEAALSLDWIDLKNLVEGFVRSADRQVLFKHQ